MLWDCNLQRVIETVGSKTADKGTPPVPASSTTPSSTEAEDGTCW